MRHAPGSLKARENLALRNTDRKTIHCSLPLPTIDLLFSDLKFVNFQSKNKSWFGKSIVEYFKIGKLRDHKKDSVYDDCLGFINFIIHRLTRLWK